VNAWFIFLLLFILTGEFSPAVTVLNAATNQHNTIVVNCRDWYTIRELGYCFTNVHNSKTDQCLKREILQTIGYMDTIITSFLAVGRAYKMDISNSAGNWSNCSTSSPAKSFVLLKNISMHTNFWECKINSECTSVTQNAFRLVRYEYRIM